MHKKIRLFLKIFLTRLLSWVREGWLESFVYGLVVCKVDTLSSKEALRLLFRLDNRFYALQGLKATEFGGGIHTKHRHMRYHDFFC